MKHNWQLTREEHYIDKKYFEEGSYYSISGEYNEDKYCYKCTNCFLIAMLQPVLNFSWSGRSDNFERYEFFMRIQTFPMKQWTPINYDTCSAIIMKQILE